MIREDIEEMKKEVEEVQKQVQDTTIATMVINKLVHIIIALIVFIVINNIGWIWYISLPVEEVGEYTQTIEDIESSNISQEIGE